MGLTRYFIFINRLENQILTSSIRYEININVLTSYNLNTFFKNCTALKVVFRLALS